MTPEQQKIRDLTAQLAAQTVRADQAEKELDGFKTRADSAEGALVSVRERLDNAESQLADSDTDGLRAQIDVLHVQIKNETTRADAAEDPERLISAVKERVALEASAIAVMRCDRAQIADMPSRTLMESVVSKLHGTDIAADKSDDYVRARFDAAVEGHVEGAKAFERITLLTAPKPGDQTETRNDSETAHASMVERNRNAWMPQA